MISQKDIEAKDLSQRIINILTKLDTLSTSLLNTAEPVAVGHVVVDEVFCRGYGMFLSEIHDDLIEIHEDLTEDDLTEKEMPS